MYKTRAYTFVTRNKDNKKIYQTMKEKKEKKTSQIRKTYNFLCVHLNFQHQYSTKSFQQLQYTFPYPIIILQPSLNRSEPKGCSLLPIQQAMGWLFSDLYKLQANW